MFKNDERADLVRIATWSAIAKNGVIQELAPPPLPDVWDAVNADSSTCSRKIAILTLVSTNVPASSYFRPTA